MNARVDLPEARNVCPTTARRLIAEGALLVDVRECVEVARMAFDVPGLVQMPLSEFEQRFDELPRDRPLVLACARKGFPVTGTAAAAGPCSGSTVAASGCCDSAPAASAAGACCAPAPAKSGRCGQA